MLGLQGLSRTDANTMHLVLFECLDIRQYTCASARVEAGYTHYCRTGRHAACIFLNLLITSTLCQSAPNTATPSKPISSAFTQFVSSMPPIAIRFALLAERTVHSSTTALYPCLEILSKTGPKKTYS